jgi:DNA-binding HxlR family transcriptional regulator
VAIEQVGARLRAPRDDDERAAELTVAGVLRLLSTGASGSILMALGEGPLRTKELTERVSGYSPRTIYRHAAKLAQLGLIERDEEPGVPSKVVHDLTEPAGRELRDLVDAYANASLGRLRNGEIGAHEWGSLALLADLWESGMVEALNLGPRTPTELSRAEHGLSFHQVSRRANLFAIGGFIRAAADVPRRRRYALTEKSRRAMALIAGVGRWRRRHVVPEGMTGLTAGEAAGLLRTVLPLAALPAHVGERFEIEVVPTRGDESGKETVWGEVGKDGSVTISRKRPGKTNCSVSGTVAAWVDAVLDGPGKGLSARGDSRLVEECLRRLQGALWEPQS